MFAGDPVMHEAEESQCCVILSGRRNNVEFCLLRNIVFILALCLVACCSFLKIFDPFKLGNLRRTGDADQYFRAGGRALNIGLLGAHC